MSMLIRFMFGQTRSHEAIAIHPTQDQYSDPDEITTDS